MPAKCTGQSQLWSLEEKKIWSCVRPEGVRSENWVTKQRREGRKNSTKGGKGWQTGGNFDQATPAKARQWRGSYHNLVSQGSTVKPSYRESLQGFTSPESLVAQFLGRMWSKWEIRDRHHPVCHFYVSIKQLERSLCKGHMLWRLEMLDLQCL